MAEDKGTSTPNQEKEQGAWSVIRRVVEVVLLASLIVVSIAVLYFAPNLPTPGEIVSQAGLWGIRSVALCVVFSALGRLIHIGYMCQWTGLGGEDLPKENENKELRRGKTLWDWLDLLI